MLSRAYSRKITINELTSVADGFGGFTTNATTIGSYWANVAPSSSFKPEGQGTNGLKADYTFRIRTNKALENKVDNIEIVFNNETYSISSYEYDDELFRFITIRASKKQ